MSSSGSNPNRQVIPVKGQFFCDGHWYVLSSSSLGGSSLSPKQIGDRLQSDDPKVIRQLTREGICLPLNFPADCSLDDAVIILGELNEQEEREWIGRLQSKLNIPCGEFMLMGGGLDEDFEVALAHFEAPDPHYVCFQKLNVEPGEYLVEVYAFLGSSTVNDAWEELPGKAEPMREWWNSTRSNEELADWIPFFEEEDYVDSEDFGLLEYIIRLAPLQGEAPTPIVDEEHQWCSVYEMRRPIPCPCGIKREPYGRDHS